MSNTLEDITSVFFGCVEEEGEKCLEKVVNLCRDKLELNDFTVNDKIDRCHRIGKLYDLVENLAPLLLG